MATIAIGDIHGNVRALDELLSIILPELGEHDELVFLGDYIDRGPSPRGCVDRIVELQRDSPFDVIALLGNHEEWMLRSFEDPTKHSWIIAMEAVTTIASYSTDVSDQLLEELRRLGPKLVTEQRPLPYELFFSAMPADHLEFFRGLRPYYRSKDAVFSHGGLDPSAGPAENQDVESLLWGTEDFPAGYAEDENHVYGHWNNASVDDDGWPHPRVENNTYGIDTIGHGVLTAIRLPDAKIFQSGRYPVRAQEA